MISIILLLAALLVPVLVRSKERGAATDDLAKLRQMAVAEELYFADEQRHVYSPSALVAAGRLPMSLLRSDLDRTSRGFANELRQEARTHVTLEDIPYKVSFVTLADTLGLWDVATQSMRYSHHRKPFADDPDAGWAATPFPKQVCKWHDLHRYEEPSYWYLAYRRLRLDGSVRRPTCLLWVTSDGHDAGCPHAIFFGTPEDCRIHTPL